VGIQFGQFAAGAFMHDGAAAQMNTATGEAITPAARRGQVTTTGPWHVSTRTPQRLRWAHGVVDLGAPMRELTPLSPVLWGPSSRVE
jgi:hypothetical protein